MRQLDAGLPAETKDRRWLETAVRVLNQKRKDGDKGFRGKTHSGTTKIVTPNRPKKNATAYEKRKAKARLRRRAAIELRIGHLKSDFRLGRNFLKGQVGDAINLLLAAAASNLSRWMRQVLFAPVSAIQNWARECRAFRSPVPA